MKLKCVIVDDEPNAVELLTLHVSKVPYLELSTVFYNSLEVITYTQHNKVDILFLDIQLPGIKGIDLISLLNRNIAVVFTTAYSQYAVESYEKNAVDYLLKPITFKRFMQAVTKAIEKRNAIAHENNVPVQENTYTFVKSGKQMLKVDYKSILYFEGDKEYVRMVTKTEKVLLYKRMKEIANELPENFIRIHNSCIINIDHIHKIEDNHVYLSDRRLPVSDTYRSDFLSRINRSLI
jgi:two-component system, LytTR family, response regulator